MRLTGIFAVTVDSVACVAELNGRIIACDCRIGVENILTVMVEYGKIY